MPLSVVALKKWFRNLHLLNIHVMLLGQEGRLAAIDTVQEFLWELDMKPHMDLVKSHIVTKLSDSKILNNLVEDFNSQRIFQCQKFPKKFFGEIRLEDKLVDTCFFLTFISKLLYFPVGLMITCNTVKQDTYFQQMHMWFRTKNLERTLRCVAQ